MNAVFDSTDGVVYLSVRITQSTFYELRFDGLKKKCYFPPNLGSSLRRNIVSKNELPDIQPPNTTKYRLGASGAGIIVCQERSKHSFRALLSMRSRMVGVGYTNTASEAVLY